MISEPRSFALRYDLTENGRGANVSGEEAEEEVEENDIEPIACLDLVQRTAEEADTPTSIKLKSLPVANSTKNKP
jgi:hypothetical protein